MSLVVEEYLVSVVVITYNSSRFIIDTLESIKNQTYKNLELIISDDCSQDNTVEICQTWLSGNAHRFIRTKVVTSKVNTGITANMNRAYSAANGIWIKPIAGDDVLLINCIENNIAYVLKNRFAEIVFSKIQVLSNNDAVYLYGTKIFNRYDLKLALPHREFKYLILCENFIPAATTSIKRELWDAMGGFDERIPMMEDWPFWIKLIQNKKRLYFNPIPTVMYRMHDQSISLNKRPSARYMESVTLAYKYVRGVQYQCNKMLWLYARSLGIDYINNPVKSLFKSIIRIVNPITYYMLYIHLKLIFNNGIKRYSNP